MNRETVQSFFIRVCRDSGFQMSAASATKFTARALHIHPLEVWCQFASLDQMKEIASGDHPSVKP